ncbi:hypothetical protein Cob_v010901 [Colletotrichum orbiculare MAFF 240422]|uniref:Uncharacterized protein n=1 Tax=Colletotrichum orbiculare (strain 104-T / ATCC 96160 / CBS 514.97 / LARS 414 / MAFF 240422) TaxID=1213857 RepID=A0A484FF34_COLOR|nr:hypothetical protein Cob_v010901 [Colletotrichum orbiculare MAFF 240422]
MCQVVDDLLPLHSQQKHPQSDLHGRRCCELRSTIKALSTSPPEGLEKAIQRTRPSPTALQDSNPTVSPSYLISNS